MEITKKMKKTPEWIIHKGIVFSNQIYIWHTICPPWIAEYKYAIVKSQNNSKCDICGKRPPDYIIFQHKLLRKENDVKYE